MKRLTGETEEKRYERRFRTEILLPPVLEQWTGEVIEGLESKEIKVFRPDDETAFEEVPENGGARLLFAKATLPVSIPEWLPVVCQFVRQEGFPDVVRRDEGMERGQWAACFYSNPREVLWPLDLGNPAGPGALISGIVLAKETVDLLLHGSISEGAFKFMIAHELVHAFNALRFVVPAFLDWDSFWRIMLGEGSHCDLLMSDLRDAGLFIDDYGSDNELAFVCQYWPSRAEGWFEAWGLQEWPEPTSLKERT